MLNLKLKNNNNKNKKEKERKMVESGGHVESCEWSHQTHLHFDLYYTLPKPLELRNSLSTNNYHAP